MGAGSWGGLLPAASVSHKMNRRYKAVTAHTTHSNPFAPADNRLRQRHSASRLPKNDSPAPAIVQ